MGAAHPARHAQRHHVHRGRIDLFSHGTVKATLPAGDYQMFVSVSPGKTVDATITPILRKLN